MSAPTSTEARIAIGRAKDLPMLEGRAVTVDGRQIAVFRLPDGWAAVDGACPHRGGPLADGLVADACVICPLHARRFDLRTGGERGGADHMIVHDVVERDGQLWLLLADARAGAGSADGGGAMVGG